MMSRSPNMRQPIPAAFFTGIAFSIVNARFFYSFQRASTMRVVAQFTSFAPRHEVCELVDRGVYGGIPAILAGVNPACRLDRCLSPTGLSDSPFVLGSTRWFSSISRRLEFLSSSFGCRALFFKRGGVCQ